MNARRFVSGSSIILAGWLGATFFNEVPAQRYPRLDKNPATAALSEGSSENEAELIATQQDPADLKISLSN